VSSLLERVMHDFLSFPQAGATAGASGLPRSVPRCIYGVVTINTGSDDLMAQSSTMLVENSNDATRLHLISLFTR
jgi:hypothetical protein